MCCACSKLCDVNSQVCDVMCKGVCERLVRSGDGRTEVHRDVLYGHGRRWGHVSSLGTEM